MNHQNPMHGVAGWIVKRKAFVLLLFAALFLFSLFSMNWVKVEEDTVYFLDESTQSRQCLDIDAKEFTSFGSMYCMVSHVTQEETETLEKALGEQDNIAYYTKQIRQEENGSYVATFYLSFNSEADAPESMTTYEEICQLVEPYETHYVYSELVDDMEATVNQQMGVIIALIAVAVLVILLLTSRSFGEIPVLLLVFVFAAVLNMGTNFLLGTISLISNAVAVTLQLALSLDYAIIFVNRYWEAHETLSVREAVVKALRGAAPEILSSSLTTIAGLLAMTFMTFGLGRDMGIVLIKAIVISLGTVFLLMPCLLALCGGMMDKSRHRRLIPEIPFLGRFAHATRRVIPLLFGAALVVAFCLFSKVEYLYDEMKAPVKHPLDITVSYMAITEELGTNDVEILVPAGDYEKEKNLLAALAAEEKVRSVTGIANTEALGDYCLADAVGVAEVMELAEVDELTAQGVVALYMIENGQSDRLAELDSYKAPLIDLFTCLYNHIDEPELEVSEEQKTEIRELYALLERTERELQGEHYSRMVLSLDAPLDSEETYALLKRLEEITASYYPEDTHIAGYSVIYRDFAQSFGTDKVITSVLSIVLVMLILLLAFRSVAMPVLLILVIQGSIWMNFGLHSLVGGPIHFICYLIVSSIMMGSNIDYAIVISSRFRELRGDGIAPREAMVQTLCFALPTVLTSGGIMALSGLLIYEFISTGVVAGFGLYLATGTLITVCLVLFVLPQILLLTEGVVKKTGFSLPAFRHPARVARTAVAFVCLVAIAAGILVALPWSSNLRMKQQQYKEDLAQLEKLTQEEEEARKALEEFDSYGLTEQYLTLTLGPAQLEAGKEELASASVQLEEGQAQYDAGLEEYEGYLSQFEAGQEELAAGEKELKENTELYNDYYAQYEEGLALYNDSLKQYEEGKQQLADGQAQYDAAIEEYNAGKQELEEFTVLYNTLIDGYNRYLALKEEYEEAVAAGDKGKAAGLQVRMAAAKLAYETDFTGSGSIGELLQEYEDGKKELADAEVQLAAAEKELADGYAQLADAEKQLADGKKELEEAAAELADGKAQLEDGEQQIADGKKELADAEEQLAAGKEELDAGAKELEDGYAQYAEGEQQLKEAEEQIREAEEGYESGSASLQELFADKEAVEEKLTTLHCSGDLPAGADAAYAQSYCEEESAQVKTNLRKHLLLAGALLLLGLCGLAVIAVSKHKESKTREG